MSEEGSEDSPPRPKRKIKKVMVLSSDSSSDSDDSVTVVGSRRKRLRVLSDEGSESSGSSVVCVGTRRKRALPKLRDSDGDSDTSGWATDHSDAPRPTVSAARPTSGFASDSSEGNSDKCSICLLRFTNQEVGTPQSCEHIFCLDCITEWSKNVNTCPVDRMTFDFIVVRSCAGGRVLRTEPVKMVERRPSVELLVIEDPTVCEVCGRTDHEETMLLCDGCDLGYHMQCLTPPLSEVPIDQWLCPNCDNLLSDVDYLFSGITEMDSEVPITTRSAGAREGRNVRSSRNSSVAEEPSTSSGRRGSRFNSDDLPSTSRGSRSALGSSSRTSTRRKTSAHTHRRPKRRRAKTVIIEYEVQENGKFPVTRQVKRKLKKRKSKRRQPRTAARRSHVRAAVRAQLATQRAERPGAGLAPRRAAGLAPARAASLATLRTRAAVPALSLFGEPHDLHYFSDEGEGAVSESASTAVAARPTSTILSAYRQARRKMITIPSPTHASSAPDVLSSILESQTLLHSKKSVVSISVDGSVNIKLETRESTHLPKTISDDTKQSRKLDLTQDQDAAKKVPSYPGQSRGGRGWGGGYTGNYHREQGSLSRGGGYDGYGGAGGYQGRQGNAFNQNNHARRDDMDVYNNYSRRPHQYPQGDETNFDRNRRQAPEQNRPQNNQPQNQRHNDQNQGRYSLGPSWQPYVPPPVGPRQDPPPVQHRHSFGGFENPLDMRMGPIRRQNSANSNLEPLSGTQGQQAVKAQLYRPLPEPPMFKFDKTPEVDKSEDEKSDSSLVIDTEKYDPTEPTNDDDDSGEEVPAAADAQPEAQSAAVPVTQPAAVPVTQPAAQPAAVPVTQPAPQPPAPAEPPVPDGPDVQGLLAGMDTMNVPASVLDSAVRQVLREHRGLLAPPAPSDDDSEGDCPNFSIYSAASVHIANSAAAPAPPAPAPSTGLEDLVQEDDDEPPARRAPLPPPSKNTCDEQFKEKVSKRCPITTNPRNPIKIKLNTPSLIKRQVSLYDEEEQDLEDEEVVEDAELAPTAGSADEMPQEKARRDPSPLKEEIFSDGNAEEPVGATKEEPDKLHAEVPKSTVEVPKDMKEAHSPSVDIDASETGDKMDEDDEPDSLLRDATPPHRRRSRSTDSERDDLSAGEDLLPLDGDHARASVDRNDDLLEKMTESISETEDERSYTPCLDENKSKDTSLETEKEKGIEGLDTEMISEDEGNEMFSDTERASPAPSPAASPDRPAAREDGEIPDRKKEPRADDAKKKKKKDSKKEGKDKGKGKSKKGEVAFKKLSKSGKERNYRDKDKKRERRESSDADRDRAKRRKERRKDLERYDVRTVVSEKRRRPKDAFGRDVSPPPSPRLTPRDPSPRRRSASRPRRSASRPRRSASRPRRSASRLRRSASRPRRSASRPRRSASRPRRSASSPRRSGSRARRSASRVRRSASRVRRSVSRARAAASPRSASGGPRRRRDKRTSPRRRRSTERSRKRRRSGSGSKSPRPKLAKKKKRVRSESGRRSPRRRSPRRRRARRRSASRSAEPAAEPAGSLDSRLLSPRTPPPEPEPPRERRHAERPRHRRARDAAPPSKEVFTSGDNILVSVSFKEQEVADGSARAARRRSRRRRRRRPAPDAEPAAPRPVAIIDLERSPFRELTPSPRHVIVLSDSEPGDKEAERAAAGPAAAPEPHGAVGPKTPPEPGRAAAAPPPEPAADEARGPNTPPEPPDSPDAYDPYEPTRSASASPGPARSASPPRPCITLETAQKTNMSADDVIDRRPLSPIEKVMALLQSTRDVSPEPPPSEAAPAPAASPPPAPAAAPAPAPAAPAPPPRIVLPSPTRSQPPKLFLAKPSPIKSDPIKPMQATKIQRPAALGPSTAAVAARRRSGPESEAEESPYSPGSSDFGDLFEPPAGARGFDALLERPRRKPRQAANKVPVKFNRKKGKTQVGVKIDDDNLKILDDLPSSAVEMQVKSKFLKKLNRQERVVEEVKLVLKPHYNKKHVTKDEYKDILRRAVPKICHNKTGEINPAKIQALVEAYVKKFRKKHKLGLV